MITHQEIAPPHAVAYVKMIFEKIQRKTFESMVEMKDDFKTQTQYSNYLAMQKYLARQKLVNHAKTI